MKSVADSRLSEFDRRAVRSAADVLRARCPYVARVIVFGSRARGDARADSDLDLLVLTTREVDHVERSAVTRAISPLGRELGVLFNTMVVDERAWAEGVYPVLAIAREIERDGIAA